MFQNRSKRRQTPTHGPSPDRPAGLLVVQVDGLSRPLLEELIGRRQMPVLAALLRSGRLVLDSWTPQLPPCTPASQAGILHGRNDGIPGFRWYEKSTGRMLVANRAHDAAELARRISNGRGLLSQAGASIGNLLTGDAPSSHLTLATIEGDATGYDRSRRGGGYPRDPRVYAEIAGLLLVDVAREIFATIRREDRSAPLRARLRWRYLLERAVSTVPLRLLSTALVAGAMHRGRPVIYVDFTGHDEVAHSRGPRSPEAARAAKSIDESIGVLLRAARRAPRRYRLIVLSDHGQSWGATFSDRYGVSLEELIARTMGPGTTYHGATLPSEYRDSGVRLASHIGPDRVGAWIAAAIERARRYRTRSGISDGKEAGASRIRAGDDPQAADVVIAASGSLALVSFPKVPGALTREDIERRYPGLLGALACHPGIALVVVRSEDGPVAVGRKGVRHLAKGFVEGSDPTAAFGPLAPDSLQRLAAFDDAGDMIVLGAVDPATEEIVSFEELVGSHGGLGGWQERPFLAHPPALRLEDTLVGAPALYAQLATWMASLGLPDPRSG